MTVRKYDKVDDGYIKGVVHDKQGICFCCNKTTRVIAFHHITDVNLPYNIKLKDTILNPEPVKLRLRRSGVALQAMSVGIGCGCYAKFHRQMAHIVDNIQRRENG
jgi:hypothetical protein